MDHIKTLINNAKSLAQLAEGREGPETNEAAAQLAQTYALIAIAELLLLSEQNAEADRERQEIREIWK